MDYFLTFFFICHVNYIKIKANNRALKYQKSHMTQHNVTTWAQYFGLFNKVWAHDTHLLTIGHAVFGGLLRINSSI